jgi:superfamily I DNA and/or RNA helicase
VKCRYCRSLFQRLVAVGSESVLLDGQYRMHSAIAAFPNMQFYGSQTRNGVTQAQRRSSPLSFFVEGGNPAFFWNVAGVSRRRGTSLWNQMVVDGVFQIHAQLHGAGVKDADNGIISLYAAQVQRRCCSKGSCSSSTPA